MNLSLSHKCDVYLVLSSRFAWAAEDRRGLAHFASYSKQNVPVPLSADGVGGCGSPSDFLRRKTSPSGSSGGPADSKQRFQPELQKRAAEFLSEPIPAELQPHYVSGSLADIIVSRCSHAEPIDPELCEIAELTANEYDNAIAKARTPELKAYYARCQQLLREIVSACR